MCGRPPPRKVFLQRGQVWSIAVMCPAFECGRIDRWPRWVTRIGSQTLSRCRSITESRAVSRSSVRPIAILLLSLQVPGQVEVGVSQTSAGRR